MCISDVKQFKSLFEYPYGTHTFTIRFVFFFKYKSQRVHGKLRTYATFIHQAPGVFFPMLGQCFSTCGHT